MFIAIEGLDGAGKSTQVAKLRELLQSKGIESEYLHFPCFDTPVYGELIAKFLRGELGDVASVDPQLVALIYAGDRNLISPNIREWLADGKYAIIDRYVYSNIAYQCAKTSSDSEYEQLREWILDLEYNHNGIVRPDITLFLNVPFAFTKAKLSQERVGDDRDYLQGKIDIHEASLSLQERVRNIYLRQGQVDPTFRIIDCSDSEGGMASADVIFSRIREVLSL